MTDRVDPSLDPAGQPSARASLASEPSWASWLRARWRPLAGAVGALIALTLITILVARRDEDPELYVQAVWPARLSAQADALLAVAAYDSANPDRPPAGARVTLYDMSWAAEPDYFATRALAQRYVQEQDTLRVLARGELDEHGMATLTIPSQAWPDAASMKVHELLLRVEHRGQARYLSARQQVSADAPALAVTLDRPLYQPGQVVKMRALALQGDAFKPSTGVVQWRVRDPRANLILSEDLSLSGSGVSHTELALAAESAQGVYTLEVSHRGQRQTRAFEVQPFRLPTYKVEVQADQAQIEPGQLLQGQVIATYTHGERVKDAQVELDVEHELAGRQASERLRGQTDARGVMAWSWRVSPNVAPGSAITLRARVTTDVGRAEEGVGASRVSGHGYAVELLPRGLAAFHHHGLNRGVLEVRDSRGRPAPALGVTLSLPEADTERQINLVTDAQGRAPFEWTPAGRSGQATIMLTRPDGSTLRVVQELPMSYQRPAIAQAPAVAMVGQPYTLTLAPHDLAQTVVVSRRGLPMLSVLAKPDPKHERQLTLTFPEQARGLVHLIVMDAQGARRDAAPVMVRDGGASRVQVTQDRAVYSPGSQATLGLRFEPPAASSDGPAVTFAVVGVDEALYALRERADLPLEAVMRQSPEATGQLVRAVDALERGDELGLAVATTRFARAIQDPSSDPGLHVQAVELTSEIVRAQAQGRQRGWAVVLALCLLAGSLIAARATWRSVTRQALSLRRLGAFVGVSALTVPALIVLLALGQERSLAGGVFVWSLVLVGWLLGAARRDAAMPLARWMGLLGVMAVLGALQATLFNLMDSSKSSALVNIAVFTSLGALVLMTLQALLWPFILVRRGHAQAGYALATLFALPLGLVLTPVLWLGGRSMDKYAPEMALSSAPMLATRSQEAPGTAQEELADGPARPEPEPSGSAKGPRVRSYFPETMIWAPELVSDAQGRATLRVEVPDSITTWRLNTWAHTADGRFGESEDALKVWKDFFVEAQLPTQLIMGDRLLIPVTLINNREQAVTARVSAQAEGALSVLELDATAPVVVEPGRRASLTLTLLASSVGQGALTVSAALDDQGDGDAVRLAVQVEPDGRVLTQVSAGLTRDGWQATSVIPAEAIPGTGLATLKIFPSPVADALDGLEGMLRMPTGCFEQTSSANYPNIMVMQALRATPAAQWPGGAQAHAEAAKKAHKMLSLGYQRMLTFQMPDGGFALYPTYQESDLMLTAYGLMQLAQLEQVQTVDEQVMARAASRLVSRQNANGTWPVYAQRLSGGSWAQSGDAGQVRSTAFIALALASSSTLAKTHRQALDRALDHLVKRYQDAPSADALALAATALLVAQRPEQAKPVLNALLSGVTRQEQLAYWPSRQPTWMGGYGRYADVETTALSAWALIEANLGGELLGPILSYLGQQRAAYGGWGSTQATVWALRAMARLAQLSKEEVTLQISASGQPMAQASGRGEPGQVSVGPTSLLMHQLVSPALPVGVHRVQVSPDRGQSAAMLQLNTRYAVPWTSASARVPDERLGLSLKAPQAATFAQSVGVQVTLTNLQPVALGATILEAPMPPGALAPRAQLEQLQASGVIEHFEVSPSHVRLYLAGMEPSAQLTLGYTFVPLVRGQMSIPPARAYAFYAPDPITMIDGGELTVR